jgi:hypothetical protein
MFDWLFGKKESHPKPLSETKSIDISEAVINQAKIRAARDMQGSRDILSYYNLYSDTKKEIEPFKEATRVGTAAFSALTITKDDINKTSREKNKHSDEICGDGMKAWATATMNNVARDGLSVGKKKHKKLYMDANEISITKFSRWINYDRNGIYFGCNLAHYKWSWKLNKAVKVKG